MAPAVESRPSGDLTAALAMAAETAEPALPDPPANVASMDPGDPPPASVIASRRSSRPHLEDDFFARGEEIASFPPSSTEAPEIEPEPDHVARRRASPGVRERRARMRRIVGWVIAGAAALTAIGGARALLSRRSPEAKPSETSLSVPNRVVPSIAIAAPQDTAQPPSAAPPPSLADDIGQPNLDTPADPPAAAGQVRAPQRLPVVDVEIPAAPDSATDRVWETAAQSLSAQDFAGADRAFAELGHRSDAATREAARLARAVWWMANGKQAEVRPVLADLAANATTPSVQRQARELLRAN